jgi:hypothetical protein
MVPTCTAYTLEGLPTGRLTLPPRERSRGYELAVCGVDTNGDAVLGAFNEEAAILHAEGHTLRLVLTECGDAGGQVQHME